MKLNKPFPYKTNIDRTINNINEIPEPVETDLSDIKNNQNLIISLLEQLVTNTTPELEPEPDPEIDES